MLSYRKSEVKFVETAETFRVHFLKLSISVYLLFQVKAV
jgi:hypothetical protein